MAGTLPCAFNLPCDALTAYSTTAIALFTVLAAVAGTVAAVFAYRTYRHDTDPVLCIAHEESARAKPPNTDVYVIKRAMVADDKYGVQMYRQPSIDIVHPHTAIQWFQAKNIGRGVLLSADVVPQLWGEWRANRNGNGHHRDPVPIDAGRIFVNLEEGLYTFGILNELPESTTIVFWRHATYQKHVLRNKLVRGCKVRSTFVHLIGLSGKDPDEPPSERTEMQL